VTHDPDAALPARRSVFGPRRAALPASFFDRATAQVARALLGAVIDCRAGGARTCARIVEVEAYLGPHDPACHSAVGLTTRNRQLHGPPGTAYVYRIYGMHWCVNAVTRSAGFGSAVLIRAVAPLAGIAAMRRRRGRVTARDLTNGPGKLCQALGITGALDGVRLDRGIMRLLRGAAVPDDAVRVTPRVGISRATDWPLRFVVHGDPHVSRTPRAVAQRSVAESEAWLLDRDLW